MISILIFLAILVLVVVFFRALLIIALVVVLSIGLAYCGMVNYVANHQVQQTQQVEQVSNQQNEVSKPHKFTTQQLKNIDKCANDKNAHINQYQLKQFCEALEASQK